MTYLKSNKNLKFIVLIAFLFLLKTSFSQDIKHVLLDKNYPINFVGLDFSECKLVGTSSDFSNPSAIKNDYFSKWNGIFYVERGKFDVASAIKKNQVNYITETVEARNNSVDISSLVTNQTPKDFSDEKLKEIINHYTINSNNEVSFVIIINALNKFRRHAKANAVFFNTKSKKILYSKQISGEPGGFGFKNYWLGAFHNVLKEIKKESKNWKKEYK